MPKKMKTTSCIHSSPSQPYDSMSASASKGKSNTAGKKSAKMKTTKKKGGY